MSVEKVSAIEVFKGLFELMNDKEQKQVKKYLVRLNKKIKKQEYRKRLKEREVKQ